MGTKNNPGAFDCYAAADPNEEMFILLARDLDAPYVVRCWADLREEQLRQDHRAGLSLKEVERRKKKIDEARACADRMTAQYRDLDKALSLGIPLSVVLKKVQVGPLDV